METAPARKEAVRCESVEARRTRCSPGTILTPPFLHTPTNSVKLVDHYEGNLILNQLELVTLALECLHNRKTSLKFQGDVSYALMGLLRIRPKIDPSDSAFQAFAR